MARPQLFALGNPLLDQVLEMTSEEHSEWVRRFALQAHVPQEGDTVGSGMLQEVERWEALERTIALSPGGCALNTSRVLKWLSRHPTSSQEASSEVRVLFTGSVGKDAKAKQLKQIIEADGVETSFHTDPASPTGHCIGLADGFERTLVANVGAANNYDLKSFNGIQGLQSSLISSSCVYTTGFFASHSWDVVAKASELCRTSDGPLPRFAFNLSGEYVCAQKDWARRVVAILDNVDVLFGNRSELEVFIKTLESLDQNDLATELSKLLSPNRPLPFSSSSPSPVPGRTCTVVVTDGPRSIVTASLHSEKAALAQIRVFGVPEVPPEEVGDTVGAGDSFAAGFLLGVIRGWSLEQCVEEGIRGSQCMMRQQGTALPPPT